VDQYLQAILTVLSLVNPVICAAIFAKITHGEPQGARVAKASKAILAIIVILSLAALGGAQLLRVFGISLQAFQVAGGMVLVWMGFLMLRGNASPTSKTNSSAGEDAQKGGVTLSPLILFAASPGTITGVITLSVSHSPDEIPVTALVAVFVALIVTWLILILASKTSGNKKPSLVHDVSTRFMGLIVLAMGVQFALSGLSTFFQIQ
jgi:multiple antibiotic resistance protein